uniref:Ankyrin repeat and sterile alpha motif domain containing 4B n=1 Tax=Leptobrachium leishanense TaxID=445787 RepID=A0A8C5R067_9ANUR
MSTRYHQAAIDGYKDILKEATKKDVNSLDGDGMTPTLLAAYHGHLEVLELVCNRGGDPNKTDIWGNTPLHHAANNGHAHCVAFLVNFGANLFATDIEFRTPLDVAVIKERTECIRILDGAADKQLSLNPKKVARLKEQATKDAERKIKECEKLQDRHQTQMKKNFSKTNAGTLIGSKGTLPSSSGARSSNPSTISTLSKGLKDTLQLKLKRKDKNTLDKGTENNILFERDENSTGHRPAVMNVFNENDEDNSKDDKTESIFNRPGLGNIVFRRNLAADANVSSNSIPINLDDIGFKAPSGLFTDEAETSNEQDMDNEINITWNEDVELEEEGETSPLQVFLASHGLLELLGILTRDKLDLDSLMLCSNEDLQSINIQLGPRKKILNAIDKRQQALAKSGKMGDTKL